MRQYAIPKELVDDISHEWCSDGVLMLYNKNAMNYQVFHDVEQSPSFFGYYGYAESLDPYFSKVISIVTKGHLVPA